MKKYLKFVVFGLLAVLAIVGLVGTGANWTVATTASGNSLTAGTFDVLIGNQSTGATSHDVSGTWISPANWAPGDDPINGRINLHNVGNVPVNIVLSGITLAPNSMPLAKWICLTALSDSNGGVPSEDLSSLAAWTDPDVHCVNLTGLVASMNGGSFNSNGNLTNTGIFIPAGGYAWIDMTLAFSANAGNNTIGTTAGFTWTLTATQVPLHATP